MILLVEDNDAIKKGLVFTLNSNNYCVESASSISEAIRFLDKKIDLIILDVTLPDGDGFDFYEEFIKGSIPTIFLTAKDDEEDIVKGLTLGAEDYITKPFRPLELIARINKILGKNKSVIKVSNIKYDVNKMEVYKDDSIVQLSSLEIKILNLLLLNINKVVSRNTILNKKIGRAHV